MADPLFFCRLSEIRRSLDGGGFSHLIGQQQWVDQVESGMDTFQCRSEALRLQSIGLHHLGTRPPLSMLRGQLPRHNPDMVPSVKQFGDKTSPDVAGRSRNQYGTGPGAWTGRQIPAKQIVRIRSHKTEEAPMRCRSS